MKITSTTRHQIQQPESENEKSRSSSTTSQQPVTNFYQDTIDSALKQVADNKILDSKQLDSLMEKTQRQPEPKSPDRTSHLIGDWIDLPEIGNLRDRNVFAPEVGQLLTFDSATDKLESMIGARDPLKPHEEAYKASKDRSGWAKDEEETPPPATPPENGEGESGGGFVEGVKNFFSAVFGVIAGNPAAKTTTGTVTGGVTGTATGILTANTGSPEEKANEARGIIGLFRQGKTGTINEEAANQLKQIEKEYTPLPDAIAGEPKGTEENAIESYERKRRGFVDPPDGEYRILPDLDTLSPTMGTNPRQGWATDPVEGDSGEPVGEPTFGKPGVDDPPDAFGLGPSNFPDGDGPPTPED